MNVLRLSLILLAILLLQAAASEGRLLTNEQWLEDLEFVVSQLHSRHPNLYFKTSEAEFDSIIAETRGKIAKSGTDIECYFAIRKVIARVQDGHTQLSDTGIFDILDLRFPFRVNEFTDGIYITIISKDYEELFGSRIVSINEKPIEDVVEIIREVSNNDNEFSQIYWALNGITFARILHGLEIIDDTDHIELELVSRHGEMIELAIPSIHDDTDVDYGWSNRLKVGPTRGEYVSLPDILGDKTPLYFRNQGNDLKYYWFEHLMNERTIYFQFNQVERNQKNNEETFEQFSARMWDYVDKNRNDIDKFVIDLRQNDGGNAFVILPFLNEIIKRDFINRRGSLFAVAGRKTHSAASIFLYELALHTNVLFVGEPDACGADLFSDSRPAGSLPNSRFPLFIASLQYTCRLPVDNNEYIMPQFPAPFSSADYFAGNDPAMDWILNGDLRSVAEYASDEGAEKAITYYTQLKHRYGSIDWWNGLHPETIEGSVNRKAYELMRNDDFDIAYQLFELNSRLFPDSFNVWDSLGEYYYNIGDIDSSLEYYEKSIEKNPDNENGKEMIRNLKIIKKETGMK